MIRQTMPDGFERCVEFYPAFDFREDEDPDKRARGAHCAEVHFALVGPMGAISLRVFSGWGFNFSSTGHPDLELRELLTMAAGIHVHQRPRGNEKTTECQWLGQCVPDGEALTASDALFRALVQQGEEAMWQKLREWYDRSFTVH